MERRPAARASAARDNVCYTDVFRPGTLAAIRERIPAEHLRAIDDTPGISWLEWEHDHWLMDATLAVLGERDAVACWRGSIASLVEKPLLRNFVQGSLRLFGVTPGALLKRVPAGWGLAYRDFCSPRFEAVSDTSCLLHFEDVAPEAFRAPGYLHCWHAICWGVFDLEKPSSPQLDFEIEEARARAVATFHWG